MQKSRMITSVVITVIVLALMFAPMCSVGAQENVYIKRGDRFFIFRSGNITYGILHYSIEFRFIIYQNSSKVIVKEGASYYMVQSHYNYSQIAAFDGVTIWGRRLFEPNVNSKSGFFSQYNLIHTWEHAMGYGLWFPQYWHQWEYALNYTDPIVYYESFATMFNLTYGNKDFYVVKPPEGYVFSLWDGEEPGVDDISVTSPEVLPMKPALIFSDLPIVRRQNPYITDLTIMLEAQGREITEKADELYMAEQQLYMAKREIEELKSRYDFVMFLAIMTATTSLMMASIYIYSARKKKRKAG